MTTPKILVFSGSIRKASWNKKLALLATDLLNKQGVTATFLDLADYPLPIYNGDLEEAQGLPENAKKLKALFLEHQGLFIASPEYNSSLTPLLKNTIDWVSRPESDSEPNLVCFSGKIAAIAATSPGAFGGLRGLVPLRMMLENIQVMVIPQQLAIPKAYEAFDSNGHLNEPYHKQLESIIQAFTNLLKTINPL